MQSEQAFEGESDCVKVTKDVFLGRVTEDRVPAETLDFEGNDRGGNSGENSYVKRVTSDKVSGKVPESPKEDVPPDVSTLGAYEIYVTCENLKEGLGIALIDTGAQVSLVREEALKPGKVEVIHCRNESISGITGQLIKVKGMKNLCINETEVFPFRVLESLPRNLDIILGQDWLKSNGYVISKQVVLAPHSETVCRFQTRERGVRFIEHENIQPGVYSATCLTECKENYFNCLLVNMTDEAKVIYAKPMLKKPPSLKCEGGSTIMSQGDRLKLLQESLRLGHVTEGRQKIIDICYEFNDIFRLPGDKLTAVSATTHKIPTPTIPKGRAITLKNYRLAEAHKDEIDRQIKQMLEDDIIQPSNSEWNFPLIVVPKKMDASGKKKWRICIDFRRLNDLTVGDSYPLPNIQDILDKIGKARYFSALDCASGYLQVPIEQEDRCKTAFSTANGHFEYKRMPFGLKAAPATYQRMMNCILRESIGDRCWVYVDDVLVVGNTLSLHNQKLREVFMQMRKFNIQVEPDKCEFLKPELNYLGHVITANGVKPDPQKIKSVEDFPLPKNQKDVKAFLGLCGYYRKFIHNFSSIAKPLNELLKKNVDWKWTDRCEESFQNLKEKLTKAPLLKYPDFTQPFVLTTDASGYAIAGILSQGKIGQDQPIAYASRTLNNAEVNYSTTEKECLAIVWACKHFRPYLLGRKFTICTDHKGLTWIFNVRDPSSRLLRWKLLLAEFDFEIIYKAGKRNCNADCLSRYPQANVVRKQDLTPEKKIQIIKEFHDCPVGGHQGLNRTVDRIKLYISWSNMEQDVKEYIKHCEICQKQKYSLETKQELEITDTQDEPWQKIYLDIVGPMALTERDNKYLLTCQDNLSKYLIAIPLVDQTVQQVAQKLVEHVICIFGIPNVIITDRGSNFCSELFKRICKLFKIKDIKTTAYRPESNGALERSHLTVIQYLRCFINNKELNNWDEWIPYANFMYNTTPHSVTKFSPYELLFGKICSIPGALQKESPLYNYDDLASKIKFQMQQCRKIAKANLEKFKEKQRERVKSREREFQEKDLVLLKVEKRSKLEPLWEGPYEIQKVEGVNMTIKGINKRKTQLVHSNRLKPFYPPLQDETRKNVD